MKHPAVILQVYILQSHSNGGPFGHSAAAPRGPVMPRCAFASIRHTVDTHRLDGQRGDGLGKATARAWDGHPSAMRLKSCNMLPTIFNTSSHVLPVHRRQTMASTHRRVQPQQAGAHFPLCRGSGSAILPSSSTRVRALLMVVLAQSLLTRASVVGHAHARLRLRSTRAIVAVPLAHGSLKNAVHAVLHALRGSCRRRRQPRQCRMLNHTSCSRTVSAVPPRTSHCESSHASRNQEFEWHPRAGSRTRPAAAPQRKH
jgi:hypothetical protein